MGAMVQLLPSQTGGGICQLEKQPLCCHRCGAIINPYCTLDVHAGKWKCNFCLYGNSASTESGKVDLQISPELSSTAVDYFTPSQDAPAGRRKELQVVVFVVDLTFGEQVLHLIVESLKRAIGKMDDSVHVGLLLVDSCISLVNLEKSEGMVELHCVPGHTVTIPGSLRRPAGGFSSCLSSLESCRSNLYFVLDALHTSRPRLPERVRPRCIGTAIHEALNLIKETREADQEYVRRERVLLMTCGPPNHGPGAVPSDFSPESRRHRDAQKESRAFFDRLADVSVGLNVTIDLYGVSFSPIGLSLVESLPKATCGVVSLHSVITPDLFATQITESFRRRFGVNGVFDVRLSKGLRLSSIIGQVSERLTAEESGVRKLTNNACLLRSVEFGKSLCLFVEATTDFAQEDLYIQILLSWKDANDDSRVERVITCPLTPTGNLTEFLKSIHGATVGVLIAKRTALECSEAIKKNEDSKVQTARGSLAHKLSFMVQKFGKLLECRESGFLGFRLEKKWACPLELWYVAQSLYHLHRGHLLGRREAHSEEVTFLQTVFLSTNMECADRMIVPKLFVIDPASRGLLDGAAVTTALDPGQVVLVDHGLHVFVWVGRNVEREASSEGASVARSLVEVCVNYAIRKCVQRGIMPELIVLNEGDDHSIYERLTPIHRDAVADQEAQSQAMDKSAASEAERASYPKTDELSFYEWCRMVNIEPPKLNKETVAHVQG